MRKKRLTKVKMKAIDPQKFFAVPRAYESLNPGLLKSHQWFPKASGTTEW